MNLTANGTTDCVPVTRIPQHEVFKLFLLDSLAQVEVDVESFAFLDTPGSAELDTPTSAFPRQPFHINININLNLC